MHICEIQINGKDEPIYKAEIETEMQRTKRMDTKSWSKGGGMKQEINTDIYVLLCIKQITSESLLPQEPYSVLSDDLDGKEIQKEGIYLQVQLTHFAVQSKRTQHCTTVILQ